MGGTPRRGVPPYPPGGGGYPPKRPKMAILGGTPSPYIKDIFSSKKGKKRIAGNGHRVLFTPFLTLFLTPPGGSKMGQNRGLGGTPQKPHFWGFGGYPPG